MVVDEIERLLGKNPFVPSESHKAANKNIFCPAAGELNIVYLKSCLFGWTFKCE